MPLSKPSHPQPSHQACRPFCVSTHLVLPHVCKIEWVGWNCAVHKRKRVGFQMLQESNSTGLSRHTYVWTGQAGRLVSRHHHQQQPLPRSHTPTFLGWSVATKLNASHWPPAHKKSLNHPVKSIEIGKNKTSSQLFLSSKNVIGLFTLRSYSRQTM